MIVQKTTDPAGDPTVFSINASGTGTIINSGAGAVTDALDQQYDAAGDGAASRSVDAENRRIIGRPGRLLNNQDWRR